MKSVISAELKAEEAQQASTPEQDAEIDRFIAEYHQRLSREECEEIQKVSYEAEHLKSTSVELREDALKQLYIAEKLLIKGAKQGDKVALRTLHDLYEYTKDYEKLAEVRAQITKLHIKEGYNFAAFSYEMRAFNDDKAPEQYRLDAWFQALALIKGLRKDHLQKWNYSSVEACEEVLPFLLNTGDPVKVKKPHYEYARSVKRPQTNIMDEGLAYDLIDCVMEKYPARGHYWKGVKNETNSVKSVPSAFKNYKSGALLGDRDCIHKVVEFIKDGKGVVPSISEELIWRYAALALESDPDSLWGALNKIRILILERSLNSSQVGLESLRLSANKLVDQINKTSSQAKKSQPRKESTLSYGTGFIISADGMILTACHVIKDGKKILINQAEGSLPAQIVAKDEKNDIAILKADGLASKTYLSFSKAEPKQGDKISTFGFPHSNIEGRDCKYSSGEISSLIGLGSDKRYLRLNLQVSPGNSGGPLLDASNHIIGILTAKLDAVKMFDQTGDLPTGVSYAVKNDWILRLLNTNGLSQKISFNGSANKPSESIVLISAE